MISVSNSTGIWTADDGTVLVPQGQCWTGNDSNPDVNPTGLKGKLNPFYQDTHCVGPIPVDTVWQTGVWGDYNRVGLNACPLTLVSGNAFGRTGFFIHGPDARPAYYGQESEGCLVVTHNFRINMLMPLLPPGTQFKVVA